jgi:hypothetical protein
MFIKYKWMRASVMFIRLIRLSCERAFNCSSSTALISDPFCFLHSDFPCDLLSPSHIRSPRKLDRLHISNDLVWVVTETQSAGDGRSNSDTRAPTGAERELLLRALSDAHGISPTKCNFHLFFFPRRHWISCMFARPVVNWVQNAGRMGT